MAQIDVRQVRKTYNAATGTALAGVNLFIPDGTSMVLLGPSGCGKTTLLRCIAGLEGYEGDILYDGQNVVDLPPKDRGIGIVFQNYALYPNFEGKGNLGFFFRLRKREAEIDDRVRQTAEVMGLGFEALLDRMPKTLSGGQKQRVAIARAICRDPKLLLFDEPLSSLDAKLRSDTRLQIRRLISRFAVTTVYVTHDQSEATLMGDQLAIMDKGQIVQVGTYRELYDHPANVFVAGFLGAPPMNLLNAVMDNGQIKIGPLRLPLPAQTDWAHGAGIVGIRPEQWRIDPTAPVIQAVIEVIERLPAERIQLCHFTIHGQDSVARLPLDIDISIGQTLPLSINGPITLFDPASGKRQLE